VPNPNYCNGGKGAIGGPPSKGTAPMPKLYEALAEAFLAEGVDTQFVLMGDGCCDAHSISELGQGRRFGATAHNLRSTPVSRPSGGSTAGLLSAITGLMHCNKIRETDYLRRYPLRPPWA
jgi:hypothetical protein